MPTIRGVSNRGSRAVCRLLHVRQDPQEAAFLIHQIRSLESENHVNTREISPRSGGLRFRSL